MLDVGDISFHNCKIKSVLNKISQLPELWGRFPHTYKNSRIFNQFVSKFGQFSVVERASWRKMMRSFLFFRWDKLVVLYRIIKYNQNVVRHNSSNDNWVVSDYILLILYDKIIFYL
jgi:hypothetical protein